MKTDQEKIEVMQAHIAGKKIEVRFCNGNHWTATEKPAWQWGGCDYRIAREPRTIWVNEYDLGFIHAPHLTKEAASEAASSDCIRCCKFVEVLEDAV